MKAIVSGKFFFKKQHGCDPDRRRGRAQAELRAEKPGFGRKSISVREHALAACWSLLPRAKEKVSSIPHRVHQDSHGPHRPQHELLIQVEDPSIIYRVTPWAPSRPLLREVLPPALRRRPVIGTAFDDRAYDARHLCGDSCEGLAPEVRIVAILGDITLEFVSKAVPSAASPTSSRRRYGY
jgi:hypothetical protein